MAEPRASLGDARAGRGRMVMLTGEPGIGKTTMAEVIATIGAEQGFSTRWGALPRTKRSAALLAVGADHPLIDSPF